MRLDQLRIHVRVDPHPLGRVRPQIGEHRIGRGRDLLHDLLARIGPRVDRDRALAEIDVVEIGPPDRPRKVAGQRFELDHVGAEIGQKPSAGRACDQIGNLQHPHAVERRRIGVAGRRWDRSLRFRIAVGQAAERFRRTRPFRRAGHFGQVNRRAHLRDRPQHRIVQGHHHAVVVDLRVFHAFHDRPAGAKGHVGFLEQFGPLRLRLCPDDTGNRIAQFRLVFGIVAAPPALEARLRHQLADAHQIGRDTHETDMDAAKLYPVAVGAFVDAVERRAAGRMGLEYRPGQLLADDFRMKQKRTGHQRGLDRAAAARRFARQQGRRDTEIGEQRRTDSRQRVDDMHRRRPEAGHAAHHAGAGQDEILDRRFVLQRTLLAISGYRTADQAAV